MDLYLLTSISFHSILLSESCATGRHDYASFVCSASGCCSTRCSSCTATALSIFLAQGSRTSGKPGEVRHIRDRLRRLEQCARAVSAVLTPMLVTASSRVAWQRLRCGLRATARPEVEERSACSSNSRYRWLSSRAAPSCCPSQVPSSCAQDVRSLHHYSRGNG